ncbi:MAG: hypothetical protein JWR81_4177 [Pseudonocardia sp.]|nr:hypothetical protein [Pseudonocardia sp.]MDT7616571.1 hypothetical protein [Pseudonocardiales bacterium]
MVEPPRSGRRPCDAVLPASALHIRGAGRSARLGEMPYAVPCRVVDAVAEHPPVEPAEPVTMLGGGERREIPACQRGQPGELAPIQVEAQPPVRPLQGRTGRRRSRSARGCRRSHLVSVFAPASRAQSTRDSCPSPTPGVIPSRTYATELDRVKRRTTSPRRRSASAGSPSGECAIGSRVSGTSSRGWPSRRPPTSRTSTSDGDISGSATRTRAALLGREHLQCPGRLSRHDPVAGQSPQQVGELRVDGFGDRPPSRRTTPADCVPGADVGTRQRTGRPRRRSPPSPRRPLLQPRTGAPRR